MEAAAAARAPQNDARHGAYRAGPRCLAEAAAADALLGAIDGASAVTSVGDAALVAWLDEVARKPGNAASRSLPWMYIAPGADAACRVRPTRTTARKAVARRAWTGVHAPRPRSVASQIKTGLEAVVALEMAVPSPAAVRARAVQRHARAAGGVLTRTSVPRGRPATAAPPPMA